MVNGEKTAPYNDFLWSDGYSYQSAKYSTVSIASFDGVYANSGDQVSGNQNCYQDINNSLFKNISDPKYPGVKIFETDLMAEGTGVTLPNLGIFIHTSVKGRTRVDMLEHEYGHFLDYKLSPDLNNNLNSPSSIINSYLMIGLPSILNLTPRVNQLPGLGGRHKDYFTEKRADKWAEIFFRK